MRRFSTLVAFGLATLAAATLATSARAAPNTLNVDLTTDVDFTDPALAYYQPSWELEYATQLKLLNYPDASGPKSSTLTPEAAAGFPKVTANGKVYDFTIKAGFTRLSNGQPVTAANFKAAIDRIADPKMQSPATAFIDDIVGADRTPVSGVRVKGTHLIITLRRAAPDFLSRIAMPFFGAIPVDLPHDPNGELAPPSAGPYYIASRTPAKSILLKRNPYYKGKRPHNVAQISYTIGNAPEAIRLRVESGASDFAEETSVPPNAWSELSSKYGVNKGRMYAKPLLSVSYFAFNMERPIFKNNLPLRKAINFAIDRRALLAQSGVLAGKRSDQILPPGLVGFRDADLYPLKSPNIAYAKKLAKGHVGDGKLVLYTANRNPYPLRAQILAYNLKQIGIDVEIKQFQRQVQITKIGTRGEPFDITDTGWNADYADPYDFINVLLYGGNIQSANNNNVAYFNDPNFNKKMLEASLLTGAKRYSAYAALDIDLMKNAVPWAPRANQSQRMFTSARFGCFTYNNVYQANFAAACLKG